MDMEFTVIINNSPTRDNKHWRKTKTWGKIKDDLVKLVRQELGLTGAEAKSIIITRRECDLTTGWSKISGTTTSSVGAKIHHKTI